MKKRNILLDNYKGVLIFLVVFGHFLYYPALNNVDSIAYDLFEFIYIFHMPAFIFVSGYFSKSKNSCSRQSIIKLVLYYLVINTLMMIFVYFRDGTAFSFLTPLNSYWYILSLIVWRLTIKETDKIKGILPISIILALVIGFWSEFTNLLSIRRTIAFFPFFLIGYKLKPELLEKIKEKRTIIKYALSIVITSILAGLVFGYCRNNHLTTSMLLMTVYKNMGDITYRIIIFGISAIAILMLLLTSPKREIPILTKIGQNSLSIYLFHRFLPYIFIDFFPSKDYYYMYIIYAFIASIITIIILGSNFFNNLVVKTFNKLTNLVMENKYNIITIILILIIVLMSIKPLNYLYDYLFPYDYLNTVSIDTKDNNDDIISISYIGDMILLKDQVTSAYNKKTGKYDFKDMFRYAKPYLENSDLSIGVFEGPMAGNKTSYSTSNYGDGIKLYLNFPDEFADAVKWSGVDLVTTANNHILDKGLDGAMRTLDILDDKDLIHTGSYRDQKEKDTLLMLEIEGVKIAVLSYMEIANYYSTKTLVERYPYLTSITPSKNTVYFNKLKIEIENDFKQAKDKNADMIMVLSHMGTQFKHKANDKQKLWNDLFIDMGADIILTDHSHAVQPVEYRDGTLIVNCPGNFANSYIKYNGDATSIVNIYINKKTKEISSTSIVPMYTYELKEDYFVAMPIYDIYKKKNIYSMMNDDDLNRIEEVQELITKVMIDDKISVDELQKEYFLENEEFEINNLSATLDYSDYKDKDFFKLLDSSKSITFIGDSITEGTKNNYHPWYESLMSNFKKKKIINISKGSYTTKLVLQNFKEDILKSKSDVYVIAIGTNDVRYRNEKTCAMNEDDYIDNLEKLVELIKQSNEEADIVFISPWMTLDDDSISKLNAAEKDEMIDEYSASLKKYCKKNNYMYINPNNYLREFFKDKDYSRYMTDPIHPNESLGIVLYSKAILESSK